MPSSRARASGEFSWFTLADSIPGLSMDAERAAHRIVESMRRGRTEIVLTVPAKLAVRMQGAMPATTVNLLRVVDRLLPDTEDPDGRAERGMAVDARITSGVFKRLTGLTRSAAHRFNQLPGPDASPPAVRSARPPGPSTEPDNDATAGG